MNLTKDICLLMEEFIKDVNKGDIPPESLRREIEHKLLALDMELAPEDIRNDWERHYSEDSDYH